MAAYTKFKVGGKEFYRFGDYEIEADLARRMKVNAFPGGSRDEAGNTTEQRPSMVEDERATAEQLSRIADERYYAAESARTLNLTTGGQTGYKGKVSRMGGKVNAGGRYIGSRSLLRGKTGAAILGGV